VYSVIGTYFGSSQNAKGHLLILGHVYDLGGSSASDPTIRSYATAERRNFYTDRCDVVALLCLCRAKSGGLSAIASSMAVRNVKATRRPDLLDRLYHPLPVDRRGEVPEGKGSFYEAPVFNEHAGNCLCCIHDGISVRRSGFPRRGVSPRRIAKRSTCLPNWRAIRKCRST
jgi:hypothetical protein